jgi:hypothetical protein
MHFHKECYRLRILNSYSFIVTKVVDYQPRISLESNKLLSRQYNKRRMLRLEIKLIHSTINIFLIATFGLSKLKLKYQGFLSPSTIPNFEAYFYRKSLFLPLIIKKS